MRKPSSGPLVPDTLPGQLDIKSPRKPRVSREAPLQGVIAEALTWRGYLVLATNVEVPLAGKSAMIATAQRKRMGVRNGTPDLAVCLPDRRVVWLEVKTSGEAQTKLPGSGVRRRQPGRTSDDQDKLHAELRAAGHVVFVVRSIEEALVAVLAGETT